MDLKEFVSETLVQITEGVSDAQRRTEGQEGVQISPPLQGNLNTASEHGFVSTSKGKAQVVKFDVALTVTSSEKGKGGIGVFSGMLNCGGGVESGSENSSLSRVQFAIPLMLPGGGR